MTVFIHSLPLLYCCAASRNHTVSSSSDTCGSSCCIVVQQAVTIRSVVGNRHLWEFLRTCHTVCMYVCPCTHPVTCRLYVCSCVCVNAQSPDVCPRESQPYHSYCLSVARTVCSQTQTYVPCQHYWKNLALLVIFCNKPRQANSS